MTHQCRSCDSFNLNLSPFCNLAAPRWQSLVINWLFQEMLNISFTLFFFSDGLPQQWVKDISDDYGGVLPEFLRSIYPYEKNNQWDFEGLYPHGGLSFLCNKISCFQSEHLECTKQYPSFLLKGKYQNLWRIQILENALTHSTQYGKSIQVTKLEMPSCWWRQKKYEIFQPYCLSILKICKILTFV